MIPDFIDINGPFRVLPPGIHKASLSEIEARFAFNSHRLELFKGLELALFELKKSGCREVYIDGSFITDKDFPSDYDGCWEHIGINQSALNPVFLDFKNNRANQKNAFKGEFFPARAFATRQGDIFLDFFQRDKHTGMQKGILLLDLTLMS